MDLLLLRSPSRFAPNQQSVILSEPSEIVAPLLAQQTIQPRVEWTCFSFVHPVENFAPNQQSVILSEPSEMLRRFWRNKQFGRESNGPASPSFAQSRKLRAEPTICHPERAFRNRCAAFGATNNSAASRMDLLSTAGCDTAHSSPKIDPFSQPFFRPKAP